MKRFLVDNAGYIHTILFIVWLSGAMICFAVGHKCPLWITVATLAVLTAQVVFAVAEADWVNDIREESGY